jgi:hypothetical protein
MAENIPLATVAAIIWDDLNDALDHVGCARRADSVCVLPDPICGCEFCTHPDHQQASYRVYMGVGHETAIPMRTLYQEAFQSYDLRQSWIAGCIARLTREWDRQEAI